MTANEYQEYIDFYGLPLRVILKDTRRGYFHDKFITIPLWLNQENIYFQVSYILHEICHYYVPYHGPEFRKREIKLLREWNLAPRYGKVYLKELRTMQGETLWITWKNREKK